MVPNRVPLKKKWVSVLKVLGIIVVEGWSPKNQQSNSLSSPPPNHHPFPQFSYSVADDLDRHPERRMKAAFLTFEEVNLPRLKQENPNMRLSQLKQLLKKEWMKSPENPMNQRHATFNSQK